MPDCPPARLTLDREAGGPRGPRARATRVHLLLRLSPRPSIYPHSEGIKFAALDIRPARARSSRVHPRYLRVRPNR